MEGVLDQESFAALAAAQASFLTSEKVLNRNPEWENLRISAIIETREFELLGRYDKQPIETKLNLFKQDGHNYALLFCGLLQKCNKEDVNEYVLTLIEQIFLEDETICKTFLQLSSEHAALPYSSFLKFLGKKGDERDWYLGSKASMILSWLLIYDPKPNEDIVLQLVRWLTQQVRKPAAKEIASGLSALQILLRKDSFRLLFAREDGLSLLAGLLKGLSPSFQLLYQNLYCLWLLSYNTQLAETLGSIQAIPKIVHVLKNITKAKIIRMSLAILKNLLNKAKNNQQMIDMGAVLILQKIKANDKTGDEDISADLSTLLDVLEKNVNLMSSFEVYKQELGSGQLEWSPAHRSEKFWRENCQRFEENNYKPLVTLIEIMKNPEASNTVLAVACSDLGEFIKYHPRARQILQHLNAKAPLLALLSHSDPNVTKNALLSLQKLMLQNWEYLGR